MQQLHVFVSVNMSYYWPAKPILTSAFSIILQVSKNSYSLLQKHAIVLTVNVTYTHQHELMLNNNNSYIVTYNRACTNTRYNMEWPGLFTKAYYLHKVIFLPMISQPVGFITFDEMHVIIEITVKPPKTMDTILVRVTRSLVLYACFVDRCLYFFFCPLCCLFFVDIQLLITPLVSSHSSYYRLDA